MLLSVRLSYALATPMEELLAPTLHMRGDCLISLHASQHQPYQPFPQILVITIGPLNLLFHFPYSLTVSYFLRYLFFESCAGVKIA